MSNDPTGNPSPWADPASHTPPAQPAYQQPPTSPWGTPPPAGQPYGAPPPHAPAQPASPYAPAQPYGAPSPYAPPPQYGLQPPSPQWAQTAPTGSYAPTPARRAAHSPVLGMVGFFGVIVLGILMSVLFYQWGAAVGPIVAPYVDNGTLDTATMPPEVQTQLGVAGLPGMLVGVLGLVAWIICIAAVVGKRGRGWGVAGIIIGIFAPFVAFGFIVAGMVPAFG